VLERSRFFKLICESLSAILHPTMPSAAHAYPLGFTSLALRPELARIVAHGFLDYGDWAAAKHHILSTNALQTRTASTAKRFEQEVRRRLQALTIPQLELLATAPLDTCRALTWLAVLKTTPLMLAFAAGVLRHKLDAGDPVLRPSDYENFFANHAIAHPALQQCTPKTKVKIRSVLFSMLREVGILIPLEKDETIRRPPLPEEVRASILQDNPRWLAGFLVSDAELCTLHD
jgi:hypothetical protein